MRFSGQRRLGKLCGAVLEVLDAHQGTATVGEIGVSLGLKRPCDFARRHFPTLVAAGLISWEGRGKKKVAALRKGWLERLEELRESCGEIGYEYTLEYTAIVGGELEVRRNTVRVSGADELARRSVERQREAYRNRNRNVADHHPANHDADGWVEDLEPLEDVLGEGEEATAAVEDVPAPLSDLARAIGAYLSKHPDEACQTPYWLGTTLWCHNLYPGKPDRLEVLEALEELGGEAYLVGLMRGDRDAA